LEFKGYGGDFEKQKACFEKYIAQIPDAGICVLCLDSPNVAKIYEKLKSKKKNLVTYSVKDESADLMAKNINMDSRGISFDVKFKNGREIKNIKMPIYGRHNASNALVAVAIGDFLGLKDEKIKAALAAFNGVKRRFTKVGEYNGVSIIDDYGHHSTEIATTLKAAREVAGKHKVICVFQPHKYTRLRDLFNEFCNAFFDADVVIVSDIYSAGQAPIEGITQDTIIRGIEKAGHKNVIKLPSEKDLAKIIKSRIKPGDMIFCTGAGTITNWAAALSEQLKNV
jgi:UDP-N-acetylmuramate--alanine ligase